MTRRKGFKPSVSPLQRALQAVEDLQARLEKAERARSEVDAHWLSALLAARKEGRIEEELSRGGRFSADEARILGRILEVFADEYTQRGQDPSKSIVADYYNALSIAAGGEGSRGDVERYLTFGPFHEPVPGFSWMKALAEPERYPEWAKVCFDAQKEMREALFRKIDFGACRRALDLGCGRSSDIAVLALKHPHVSFTGYTIASEEARIGAQRIRSLGLGERVQIFNRDSAKDEFPGRYDLVFGFEVAHHVPNKRALVGNIGRHLNEGGHLVLADFIGRLGSSIDREAASFFATRDEWSEWLAESQIEIVECVEASQEIAAFLHHPNLDETIAQIDPIKDDANVVAVFKSYDRLGKLLTARRLDYVLLTARKRRDRTVAEIRGVNQRQLATATPYAQVALAGGCFDVAWVGRANTGPGTASAGRWLVFADAGGVGEDVARRLEAGGAQSLRVSPGAVFERATALRWTIDPARAEDYGRLLAEARTDGTVDGVVHAWSLDAAPSDGLTPAALDAAQVRGAESAILLARALAESNERAPPRVWLVTRGAQAAGAGFVEIAQSPLLGLVKSLALGHPELWGGAVDVQAGSIESQSTAVIAEIGAPDRELHVAYRNGERLVARLARRRPPEPAKAPVRGDGTYLVTGGVGALGLRVAGWLAEEGARSVVLVDGQAPGDAARRVIAELEVRGARVTVTVADVAKPMEVAALFARIADLPPLKGVVHTARVVDDAPLAQQTPERLRTLLAATVHGAFNLHRATGEHEIDFFVCFSSTSSLFGSADRASDAAASAFLDALAHHRRALGVPGLSVNWGAWGELGSAGILTPAERRAPAEGGIGEIEPRAGLRLLGDLIAAGATQVGVSPMNWPVYFKTPRPEHALAYFERVEPLTEEATAR